MLPLTTVTCRICGTDFEIREGENRRDCPACGTEASRPKVQGEPLAALRRAHQQRAACDFVNAAQSYQNVLLNRPDEAGALWGLALCKYGVEYVEDEKTHRRYPVVHFMQRRPFTEDPDYRLACQNASAADRAQYAEDAAYISRIQQGVLDAQANQPPWDVFLCYKASIPGLGDSAARTAEYAYAKELYFRLSMEGYRVFFAHETLSKVAGADYEAQIFYALHSARVMLVICANAAYLSTPWVHSEWSRFLDRVDDRDDCRLVPLLFDNCNPYALPEAFRTRRLQGLRMGEYASADNLRQVLAEQIRASAPAPSARPDPETNSALLRISMLLEDGEWSRAESRAQELIDQAPDCSEAHLSLLLARLQLPDADALASCMTPFEDNPAWKRALRFASATEKTRLTRLCEKAHAGAQRITDEKLLQQLLDARRWEQAQAEAEAFCQRYPDSTFGHRCRLLAQLGLPTVEKLASCTESFWELPAWTQLLESSGKHDQAQLMELATQAQKRRNNQSYTGLIGALSEIHLQRHMQMEDRARELLRGHQWNAAADAARTLLLSGLRSDEAHLLLLMAELQASSLKRLESYPTLFEQTDLWQSALNVSPTLRSRLNAIAQKHADFIQQVREEQAAEERRAYVKAEQDRLIRERAERIRAERERAAREKAASADSAANRERQMAFAERERLIRERAERIERLKAERSAQEAPRRTPPASAPGRIVFSRGKERLLGSTSLSIHIGDNPTPYATISADQEVCIERPEAFRVNVKGYPGDVIWSQEVTPGMSLRVEIRWPLFGSPKFIVHS